jgi:hypothetical protein
MMIILPALAVAFAAVCVWLGVRVYNRRERWAKSMLALCVGLPMLYVASFGPACWWTAPRFYPTIGPARLAPRIYLPLDHIRSRGPKIVGAALNWYATVGNDDQWPVMVRDW